MITVYLPQYIVGHWWESLLHNRRARRIAQQLMLVHGVSITLVPWLLDSSELIYGRRSRRASRRRPRGTDVGRSRSIARAGGSIRPAGPPEKADARSRRSRRSVTTGAVTRDVTRAPRRAAASRVAWKGDHSRSRTLAGRAPGRRGAPRGLPDPRRARQRRAPGLPRLGRDEPEAAGGHRRRGRLPHPRERRRPPRRAHARRRGDRALRRRPRHRRRLRRRTARAARLDERRHRRAQPRRLRDRQRVDRARSPASARFALAPRRRDRRDRDRAPREPHPVAGARRPHGRRPAAHPRSRRRDAGHGCRGRRHRRAHAHRRVHARLERAGHREPGRPSSSPWPAPSAR